MLLPQDPSIRQLGIMEPERRNLETFNGITMMANNYKNPLLPLPNRNF